MAVNWVNADKSTTTSHRGTTAQVQPLESEVTTTAGFKINQDASKSMTNLTTWSWNFPQTTAPGNAVSHVFAMSTTSPSSSASDATIVKHIRHDTGITLDLTQPYTGAAPAGLPNGQAATSTSSSSSTSSSGRDLSNKTVRIYLVHMIFMVLGWMLLAPLGILIGRFGRTMFNWFPAHRAIQSIAFLFIFIAFFLAIAAVTYDDNIHFKQTHNQLGLAMVILLIVQVALGAAAHGMRSKTGKRYIGFAHIPLGLILFGLSPYQIHLGFDTWDWAPPAYASYIIYAWSALMAILYIAGFAFLPKELRQDKEKKENVSDEHLTSRYSP